MTLSSKLVSLLFLLVSQPSWGIQCVEVVSDLSLYQNVELHVKPSAALQDPRLEKARSLKLVDDYKVLSDLSRRVLSPKKLKEIEIETNRIENSKGDHAALVFWVKNVYQSKSELSAIKDPIVKARWTIKNEKHRATFEHIESMWTQLVRRTPKRTDSSLIPLPYPLLVPGARFQEGYYWDSYFAIPTLLKTEREVLVRGQIKNFLFLLKNYGLIPNGTRDYYLSRSQPPLLSQMVRLLLEHEIKKSGKLSQKSLKWLETEVYPLIKKDYHDFWMNSKTRYDKKTGLNHHYDSENTPRPERHSTDKEETLGKSYRDVRAEAESGKDFTDAFDGEAGSFAGVLLNSVLFGVEKDLAWMAKLLGKPQEIQRYNRFAEIRKLAMNRHMWDPQSGVFRDFHLVTNQQSSIVTADTFVPLHSGLATVEQARQLRGALHLLERQGGLMSSEKKTGKQWDAPYGWAPHHYFAIQGLRQYGYHDDSKRLAQKWVTSIDRIYSKTKKVFEKIDAVLGDLPIEAGDKYPNQEGFLWTNGVYAWALTDVLGLRLTDTLR